MRYRDFEPEQAMLDVSIDRKDAAARPAAASQAQVPREPAALGREALEYLRAIAERPGMAATKRDAALGISSKTGARLRRLLFDEGLICEQWDDAIQRGPSFRDLVVTAVGRELLRANRPQNEEEQSSMAFD